MLYALSLLNVVSAARRVVDSFSVRKNRVLDDRDGALAEALKINEARSSDIFPTIETLSEDLATLQSASPLVDLAINGANFVGDTVRASGVSDEGSSTKELTWTRIVPGNEDITVRIASSGVANTTVTAAWNGTTKVLTVTRGTTATAAHVEAAIPSDAAAKFIVSVDATGAAATGVPTVGDTTLSGGKGDLLTLTIGTTPVDGTVVGCGITDVTDDAITFNFDSSNETTETVVALQLRAQGVLCPPSYLTVDHPTVDVADLSVTTAKLAAGAISADAPGRSKIAAGAIPSTKLQTQMVAVSLSAAADAGNTVDVTINVTDLEGVAVNRAQRLLCELFDANMLHADVGSWRLSETGAGAEVSTTAKPALIIDTDASGDATIRITDVATGTNADLWLRVTPVSSTNPGFPSIVAINFDT